MNTAPEHVTKDELWDGLRASMKAVLTLSDILDDTIDALRDQADAVVDDLPQGVFPPALGDALAEELGL